MKPQPYTITSETTQDAVLTLIGRLNIEKAWDITIEPHRQRRS